jgi:hypothetical protein
MTPFNNAYADSVFYLGSNHLGVESKGTVEGV